MRCQGDFDLAAATQANTWWSNTHSSVDMAQHLKKQSRNMLAKFFSKAQFRGGAITTRMPQQICSEILLVSDWHWTLVLHLMTENNPAELLKLLPSTLKRITSHVLKVHSLFLFFVCLCKSQFQNYLQITTSCDINLEINGCYRLCGSVDRYRQGHIRPPNLYKKNKPQSSHAF